MRPSIHMPFEFARLFLRVKGVRVERLQDIDNDGVAAEGLEIGAPFDDIWNGTIKKSEIPAHSLKCEVAAVIQEDSPSARETSTLVEFAVTIAMRS